MSGRTDVRTRISPRTGKGGVGFRGKVDGNVKTVNYFAGEGPLMGAREQAQKRVPFIKTFSSYGGPHSRIYISEEDESRVSRW